MMEFFDGRAWRDLGFAIMPPNISRLVGYFGRILSSASEPGLVQVAEVSSTGAIEPVSPPVVSTPVSTPSPAPPSLPSTTVTKLSPSLPTIEVRLPGGVSIAVGAGFSPAVLSQVIACLGGRSC